MIKSMTGFGRCEVLKDSRKFTVELKSVNHRYLDVNIRMPKKLNFFETSIRTLLKSYADRGKVDIFITYEDLSQSQVSVKYNAALAAEYLKYLNQMAEEFSLDNDVRVSTLSRYPEVFTMEECSEDEDELWNGLKEGRHGFGEITKFDTSDYKVHLAAEVKGSRERYMDFKAAKRMELFCQYAVAAAKEALEQSGIDMEQEDPFMVGCSIGSGIGSLQTVEREHKKLLEKGRTV